MEIDMQQVKRVAWLNSTATGYDVHVKVIIDNKEIWRHYENVTAATMRRFYRLSDSWQNTTKVKEVPWYYFRKIRHNYK